MKIKTAEQILDDLKIVRYREVFLKAMQLYSDQQNKELRENFIGRAYKIIHHLISKHDFDQATIYSVNAFLTEIRDCCKKDNSYIRGIHWDENDYPVNSEAEIQRLTTENKELEEKLMSEQIENGYLQAFRVSNEAEIQRLTKELQEAKTSDGRGWKAVERLQRANDVLRNENDKLKDQLIILKKAYGSKKTNNA